MTEKKEYIERGAVKAWLHEEDFGTPDERWRPESEFGTMIDALPAADVVEVKHGEWIESFSFGYWHYDCPFCDDGYAVKERDETKPNYCQNCGAKMDGERKEQ